MRDFATLILLTFCARSGAFNQRFSSHPQHIGAGLSVNLADPARDRACTNPPPVTRICKSDKVRRR
ncbi:hypothetical protein E1B25_06870 [Antarcticimicrobium sediminis]|uniref:Uncharacterized protein n=1 Tax=Antarcticimicrobium sediminis TaxID=2546227 RepID=A0A4R5EXL7_9RHOB|nr:hypothetical protein E1B25_06870 [Antarcticimicrobium sediminis]